MNAATAYHEAGHVVAAWSQGIGIKGATIVRQGNVAGCVELAPAGKTVRAGLDGGGAWKLRLQTERQIIVCVAGPLAQRRYRPRSRRKWHEAGDYEAAVEYASAVCGTGTQISAFIAWLETRADTILEMRWPMVQRVAEDLLKARSLTALEIQALLAGSRTAPALQ